MTPRARTRLVTLFWGLALLGITVLTYRPALGNGWVWDDNDYVTENPYLHDAHGLRTLWTDPHARPQFYPLVYTTFWVENHLWGLNPEPYHAANILLHACTALLVWRILARLGFGEKSRPTGVAAPRRWLPGPAWVVAGAFALHPVGVESVAWVTERKNVLMGLFYALALWAYLRFERLGCAADDAPPRPRTAPPTPPAPGGVQEPLLLRRAGTELPFAAGAAPQPPRALGWYVLVLVFFGIAMLAKTVAVTFPVAMLLIVWWKRGGSIFGLLGRAAMLAAAGGLAAMVFPWHWGPTPIIAAAVLGVGLVVALVMCVPWRLQAALPLVPVVLIGVPWGLFTARLEKAQVGAVGPEWALSIWQRVLIAGRALWFYAGKVVWPIHLCFIYPRWHVDPHQAWQWLFPIAAAVAGLGLLLAHRALGRGPAAAVGFFVVTLSPALGFFDVYPFRYSFVADHFQYLAMLGVIALVVGTATCLLSLAGAVVRTILGSVAVVALLAVLGTLAHARCPALHDLQTLWTDTIATNDSAWIAHDNLGLILDQQGKTPAAIAQYRKSLELKPDNAKALTNLGAALDEEGKLDEARDELELAVHNDPGYHNAHNALGHVLFRQGKVKEALAEYRQALAINPRYPEALVNLGIALASVGETGQAMGQFESALMIRPGYAVAEYNLGVLLEKQGDLEGAIQHLRAAERAPVSAEFRASLGDAHNTLGVALAKKGRLDEAVAEFRDAVRLNPGNANARANLQQAQSLQNRQVR